MRSNRYIFLFALLVIILVSVSGLYNHAESRFRTRCSRYYKSSGVRRFPRIPRLRGPLLPQVTKASTLDTTIDIHFNDYYCMDIQKGLGVDYLYPDQKLNIWATSPASGTINVNVLLLNVNDYEKIETVNRPGMRSRRPGYMTGLPPLSSSMTSQSLRKRPSP